MKSLILGLVCVLLATLPLPAAAAQPANNKKSDADKVVCKSEVVTGSRFPKKICHTKEQWARMESEAKNLVRDIHNRPLPARGDGLSG